MVQTTTGVVNAQGVTIAFGCDGTITLTQPLVLPFSTILDGTGHSVTISGNGAMRVLAMNNMPVTLKHLTVTGGASNLGAGVLEQQSNLTLDGVTVTMNAARGADGAYGGSNAGGTGSPAYGGGLYADGGTVNVIDDSSLTNNSATGGTGGNGATGGDGGSAYGSGIYITTGILSVASSSISGNSATGGTGDTQQEAGFGGQGLGGGVYADQSITTTQSVSIASNSATGGVGGAGAIAGNGGSGQGGGSGGDGGTATGGGLDDDTGNVYLTNVTLATNAATPGTPFSGGASHPSAGGGYSSSAGFTVANSIVAQNTASSAPNCNGQLSSQGNNAVYTGGRFSLYVPNYTPSFSLQPWQGIFVLSAAAGTWNPPGNAYSAGQTINLQPGWNLVAAPFPGQGQDAYQICDYGVNGIHCNLQEVATYGNGSYHIYPPSDGFPGAYHIPSTAGMWIETSSAYAWTPTTPS